MDGKGWNRLSLNAHMGAGGPQCALRPRSYATLRESFDTRRARWGGFGPCTQTQPYACARCPLWTGLAAAAEQVSFNSPLVLVRVETAYEAGAPFSGGRTTSLWMTDDAADPDYQQHGQPWTWGRLTRLQGWDLGRARRDEIGEGFWMHRTSWAPAPHVEIRTRAGASVRHVLLVTGQGACLVVCPGGCRHDERLLNAIGHQVPEVLDDEPTQVRGRRLALTGDGSGRRVAARGRSGMTISGDHEGPVRLSLTGSQWTDEQIQGVAAALLEHGRV
ncbi:hypothetical protein [Streptomyces sp. G-G2]|uniref:hypothetical protein n=1 Tax=Streptomyces sp. G-G2 TaxID=3046201 RepID=UPI0024BA6C9E|nr:hypothetical protein [Streptomyces sp. G-G2]MDJ0383247.1 hypothetical protein [Streptomyces sp. G-G2]